MVAAARSTCHDLEMTTSDTDAQPARSKLWTTPTVARIAIRKKTEGGLLLSTKENNPVYMSS